MSLLENLPHLADLQHVGYTQDRSGSDVESAQAAYVTDEPAWFQPLPANEVMLYKSRNQDVTHKLYMTRNPGLKLSDIITAKDGEDQTCPYNGQAFYVKAFSEATAGLDLLWKVLVSNNKEG
jgi:hypothetical protein